MIDYIVTFLAVFFTDLIYTKYLKSVQHNQVFASCWWATAATFTSCLAVINYTENHLMLIPACVGAFCGTWFGLLHRKEK